MKKLFQIKENVDTLQFKSFVQFATDSTLKMDFLFL